MHWCCNEHQMYSGAQKRECPHSSWEVIPDLGSKRSSPQEVKEEKKSIQIEGWSSGVQREGRVKLQSEWECPAY